MPPKRIRGRPTSNSVRAVFQPTDLTIQETTNKGKGVFTSTPIPRGTRIISEDPIITFPNIRTTYQVIDEVAKSTQENRDRFLSFGSSPSYVSAHPFMGIVQTNCVPMPERDRTGLFEIICRMNHDCRPNAQYYWDDRLGKEVLYALRDIRAQEEITVSYSKDLNRVQRRAAILSAWAFSCQCPSCSLSPEELVNSDKRIRQLTTIIDAVPMLLQTHPTVALTKIRQAIIIIEKEQLWNMLSPQYSDAFQVCVAWSDLPNAKIWAERALEARTRTHGPDCEAAAKMRAWMEDPKSHSLWGVMGTRRLSS
ncbi:hypothetical protein FRB94_002930 [Tulasnella sp. JGI-2019a]|nr:hypothetical protein FRB93_013136 [Tulasnella sp. JGI-2019a]KAG9013402.1 hypothetical protein FRB94_002930 [Tulasnella sp. JGI-2019a]